MIRLFITFDSTAQAMKMESADPGPGRLIPLPGFIQAGCGLCWMSPDLDEESWKETLQRLGIEYGKMVKAPWPD